MPKKIVAAAMFIGAALALITLNCRAQEAVTENPAAFNGTVNDDNINLRCDANTNSPVIGMLAKGSKIEVTLEKYGWYKIRLPKAAPAFVKRSLLEPIDQNTAKSKGDNVNIRMLPDQASVILGRLQKNEVVTVVSERGDWTKIEPTANTYGWIHTRFVDRIQPAAEAKQQEKTKPAAAANAEKTEAPAPGPVTIEGVVQPYGKVVNRVATHKLVAKDYSVYFLKGNADSLNSLTYHNVKITGKLTTPANEKYPIIEVTKAEALD